ncbi:MAG: hypothetical protein J3K34DRAFT_84718 [Monoraphidium minutum]|nr:MAG: hypothetical protein J3K34DRAFT_84718 [Monoraphidium minutum]
MQSLIRRQAWCSSWGALPCSSRPRPRVRARASSGGEQPESLRGVQRGPVQPAEVVESRSGPPQQPEPPAGQWGPFQDDEAFLLIDGAISKTYRNKLLEFRRALAASPELLEGMLASLPPEHRPQFDAILAEAAALGPDDELPGGPWGEEGGGGAAAGEEGGEDASGGGGGGEDPYALTREEELAWQMLSDASLPADFMGYLSQMVPEGTSEEQMVELLGQLPGDVAQELQSLFLELKEFEASDGLDMEAVAERYVELSDRIAGLTDEVDRQQDEAARAVALGEQQQQQRRQAPGQGWGPAEGEQEQQQQQQQEQWRAPGAELSGAGAVGNGSSNSGGRGVPFGPRPPGGTAAPAWQQARQQRRSMATWAL